MELSLEGKVVLVTGGSKGIGFACAFAADLGDAAAAGAMIDAVESGVGRSTSQRWRHHHSSPRRAGGTVSSGAPLSRAVPPRSPVCRSAARA